ncbi:MULTISPECIES: DUF6270 domain-containing protein [Listeria]|uniref:DUF6270 domain-containing protein n=1 Tax=Listeria TaxID=1637 RepID=UPI000B5892AE|nr:MULTISPECIES: DUF6270 domain-containing protein [Listeria]
MVKKIGVLGTCFSRNFLNSSTYFNPDYKSHYEVVFTQFHSSFIALMTDSFSFPIADYEDIPVEKKQFVVTDFEKTFFQALKKERPDFLLIDLYADALKETAFVGHNQAITISPIIEQSVIRKNLPVTKIISQTNWPLFLAHWTDAVQRFKEAISPYLREEQLVLNRCQLTTRYLDEKGDVRCYANVPKLEQYNGIWRELDRCFLAIFPKAKVVNMLEEKYVGDVRYPFGHSVSHYESGYYKTLYTKFKEVTEGGG